MHYTKSQEVKYLRDLLQKSMHVIILNMCMHDNVIFIRLYKIDCIYFLLRIVAML
jgi:hypothetical protein